MKTLIFILSYNAERHIAGVLRDIPTQYKNNPQTQILLIDDASKDNTVEAAHAYAQAEKIENIRILKNTVNQGYGGNQKVGYRYAIQNGFDVVVMLHGDGQYTPRALPDLLKPFENDSSVGCVLGVRFGQHYSPLKGGMPFYKYVGNRILTWSQNWLAGARLAEWHTGYRAYSIRALSETAFTLNTHDFHFDTEILLQLIHAKAKIVEVNIPTHYGDEICHVNGMRYAKDVIKASTKFFFQKYHLFYDVRFHPEVLNEAHLSLEHHEPIYEDKFKSLSPHSLVCMDDEIVAPKSRVLDVGCSRGYVASFLSQRKHCAVTAVDMLPENEVLHGSFEYEQIDLDQERKRFHELLDRKDFDVVLMLDILEHLSTPELFLLGLSQRSYQHQPKFVMSTANVAFFVIRIMLALGHFNYGRRGILDVTHKRLFSVNTFEHVLLQTGFVITGKRYIPFPFAALGWSDPWAKRFEKINTMLIKIMPRLFSYQVLVETVPISTPDMVLERALKTEIQRK